MNMNLCKRRRRHKHSIILFSSPFFSYPDLNLCQSFLSLGINTPLETCYQVLLAAFYAGHIVLCKFKIFAALLKLRGKGDGKGARF